MLKREKNREEHQYVNTGPIHSSPSQAAMTRLTHSLILPVAGTEHVRTYIYVCMDFFSAGASSMGGHVYLLNTFLLFLVRYGIERVGIWGKAVRVGVLHICIYIWGPPRPWPRVLGGRGFA